MCVCVRPLLIPRWRVIEPISASRDPVMIKSADTPAASFRRRTNTRPSCTTVCERDQKGAFCYFTPAAASCAQCAPVRGATGWTPLGTRGLMTKKKQKNKQKERFIRFIHPHVQTEHAVKHTDERSAPAAAEVDAFWRRWATNLLSGSAAPASPSAAALHLRWMPTVRLFGPSRTHARHQPEQQEQEEQAGGAEVSPSAPADSQKLGFCCWFVCVQAETSPSRTRVCARARVCVCVFDSSRAQLIPAVSRATCCHSNPPGRRFGAETLRTRNSGEKAIT